MALAKLAGVAALSAITFGGIYFSSTTQTSADGGTQNPPKKTEFSLHDTEEYKTENTKFGHKFSRYFLSTTKNENDTKWGERLEAIKKVATGSSPTLTSGSYFETLKTTQTVATLKTACKTKYDATDYTTDSDKDKWKEVWIYCSLGGTSPVTLGNSQASTETTNLESGGIWKDKVGESKKAELLSVYSQDNEWIWNIKEEERDIATTDTFFTGKPNQKLKDICQAAYKEDKNGSNNTMEAQTVKYCAKPRVNSN